MMKILQLFGFGKPEPKVKLVNEPYKVRLTRGSLAIHASQPFYCKVGNFSLITDAPQLRYHDGVTPGGRVIDLDPVLWFDIMREYYPNFELKVM